jgi:predicted RNA-binding Zn-ribbon protein involved in translation (DUF1610 family)
MRETMKTGCYCPNCDQELQPRSTSDAPTTNQAGETIWPDEYELLCPECGEVTLFADDVDSGPH